MLALAGCFSDLPPEEEVPSLPATASPPVTSASAPVYAPPSHIASEPAAQGGYGPASRIGEAVKAPSVRVGLLVPLSGESKGLGQSLLDAAVLAIYDKYGALSPREIRARLEILPEDTGDSIEGAEKAAQDAIQAGATLLLGPVFSKQVGAVASIARHRSIPIVTFSNNTAIAGDGVYLFGFIPEQQVTRIVRYALARKIASIAALVPSNPYGAAVVKNLSAEARKGGGRAHPIEYYSEDMTALGANVTRLGRFLQDENGKGQALFIAEGGAKLKVIADALTAGGVSAGSVQLLGTGVWDDSDTLKWPALRGAWFVSSPPEKYHAFEQHFVSTFGYKPERRASLSYDAVALAATLALSAHGKAFHASMLLDPVGFNGPANGIFRFRDDGTIERGLSVLQVTPLGFKTIDPAPALFGQ